MIFPFRGLQIVRTFITRRFAAMLKPGTSIEMTKGYKGVRGVIVERTDSPFEFYVLRLENGIQLVAGPTAFVTTPEGEEA
jgi:hypothetical protein